jgi:hypothetical protein
MNVGMLWFDNDPKTDFSTKVERAAIYYRNKYGNTPTLCYVHPTMLAKILAGNVEPTGFKAAGVEVRSTRSILPNHIWIGVNGMKVS